MKVIVGEQEFDLTESQLREVFYEISVIDRKVTKGLEKISDQIAALDNTEFMVFRRDVALKMLDLKLKPDALFDVCFDIVLAGDELKKMDVATHEHLDLTINLDEVFAKVRASKNFNKFLSFTVKSQHSYHFDPEFILFIYYWQKDLNEYLHKNKSIFSFLKRNKSENLEGLPYVLGELGYHVDEALKIVAQESGEIFLHILKDLMKAGADAGKVLEYAVARADLEFVDELLRNKANPNVTDYNGETLLGLAIDRGEAIILDLLLEYKADPNIKNILGETPLLKACKRDDVTMVDILLNAGANVDMDDNDGNTPFIAAVDRGNKVLVDLLINYNVDFSKIKYLFKPGMTERRRKYIEMLIELSGASEEDYTKILEQNVAEKEKLEGYKGEFQVAKKDLEEKSSFHGIVTPDSEITEDILGQQYKIDEKLVEAVVKREADSVLQALQKGADPDMSNPEGLSNSSLIHLASWHNDIEIVKHLLDFKVPVDKQDANGDTSLFFAVFKENLELFKLLISKGADIYLTNNSGVSPYDLMMERKMDGFLELVEQAA